MGRRMMKSYLRTAALLLVGTIAPDPESSRAKNLVESVRCAASPSSTGAINSSKQSRGSGTLISSSLRRVREVGGRTTVLRLLNNGWRKKCFGTLVVGPGPIGARGRRARAAEPVEPAVTIRARRGLGASLRGFGEDGNFLRQRRQKKDTSNSALTHRKSQLSFHIERSPLLHVIPAITPATEQVDRGRTPGSYRMTAEFCPRPALLMERGWKGTICVLEGAACAGAGKLMMRRRR